MKRNVILVVSIAVASLLVFALTVQPKGQAVWQRPLIPTPENDGRIPPEAYPFIVAGRHRTIQHVYDICEQLAGPERTNRWRVIMRYLRKRDMKNASRVLRGEPHPSLYSLHMAITKLCTDFGSPPEWFTNNTAKLQGP